MNKRGEQLVTNSYPRDVISVTRGKYVYHIVETMDDVILKQHKRSSIADIFLGKRNLFDDDTRDDSEVVLELGRIILLLLAEARQIHLPKIK